MIRNYLNHLHTREEDKYKATTIKTVLSQISAWVIAYTDMNPAGNLNLQRLIRRWITAEEIKQSKVFAADEIRRVFHIARFSNRY